MTYINKLSPFHANKYLTKKTPHLYGTPTIVRYSILAGENNDLGFKSNKENVAAIL